MKAVTHQTEKRRFSSETVIGILKHRHGMAKTSENGVAAKSAGQQWRWHRGGQLLAKSEKRQHGEYKQRQMRLAAMAAAWRLAQKRHLK